MDLGTNKENGIIEKTLKPGELTGEIIANDRLKKYGHKSRIDSRSLKEKEEAERKAVLLKLRRKPSGFQKLLNWTERQ